MMYKGDLTQIAVRTGIDINNVVTFYNSEKFEQTVKAITRSKAMAKLPEVMEGLLDQLLSRTVPAPTAKFNLYFQLVGALKPTKAVKAYGFSEEEVKATPEETKQMAEKLYEESKKVEKELEKFNRFKETSANQVYDEMDEA